MAKGVAEYRAGHYASAVDWLNRFSPRADGVHCDATTLAVLAMAKLRLSPEPRSVAAEPSNAQLADEARTALAHAEAILSQKMPDPKAGRPWGTQWPYTIDNFHDWLHARILTNEAKALLEADKKTERR
jgi:hypothetical protein